MQRAMMTTVNMFCNHPNKDEIKFIVLPMCREIIHTMNDLCMDAFELIEKYGPGKPASKGIQFDFSMILAYGVPQLW